MIAMGAYAPGCCKLCEASARVPKRSPCEHCDVHKAVPVHFKQVPPIHPHSNSHRHSPKPHQPITIPWVFSCVAHMVTLWGPFGPYPTLSPSCPSTPPGLPDLLLDDHLGRLGDAHEANFVLRVSVTLRTAPVSSCLQCVRNVTVRRLQQLHNV